jgi:alpha-galactosidase
MTHCPTCLRIASPLLILASAMTTISVADDTGKQTTNMKEPGNLISRMDARRKLAVIGNRLVQLEINWERGLRLTHLRNLATGVDWIPQPPKYSWGTEAMVPDAPGSEVSGWRRQDIWPNLAPPSSEFLLRYSQNTELPSSKSGDHSATTKAQDVTLTGESPCIFVPERSRAAVEGDLARLEITVALEKHPLDICLHVEIRQDVPAIRRWVTVHNRGDKPWLLHRLTSASLSLRPSASDLELYWIESFTHPLSVDRGASHWRQATRHMELLGPSVLRTLRYDAARPRPHDGSNGCMAWLALRDPSLNEGLFAGWEWSGLFDAEVGDFQEGAGVFGLRLGFSDERGYARSLAPGQTFTTPRVLCGFFRGDAEEAGRVTRHVAERLFGLPWPEKRPPMFIGYCTWNNWQDFVSNTGHLKPERLDREIQRCRELGVELFILDYDWFPLLGDFRSDPARFPDGVEAISRKVHAAGMKFGLWMGFGQAHPDAPVVREHPEFLVTKDGKPVTGGWGMRNLCFAYEPCRKYVLEEICRVIKGFDVDWLKHDFYLVSVSDARQHAPNATDTRIETVEGYYWIMDRLRQRFPRLYLDNWTPEMGGADFGNFQRHHSMLMADDYHPLASRSTLHGISHLFPPNRTHAYLRAFSRDDERSPYAYRSAAFGCGMYLLNDILLWDKTTMDVAKREIQLVKQDRDLFLDGEIYNLFPGKQPDHYGWEGRFVWSPSQRRGMAQVFRNHDARDRISVRLRGIPLDGRYSVELVDSHTTTRADGRSLVEQGLEVTLPRPFTVEILRVREE